MFTINQSKEILNLLISKGIEFKLHNGVPVIYSKHKIDPNLFSIAKKYREIKPGSVVIFGERHLDYLRQDIIPIKPIKKTIGIIIKKEINKLCLRV